MAFFFSSSAGGASFDGTLSTGNLVIVDGLILQENNTGTVELSGSSAAATGGNIKLWGSSHASDAGDVALRDGSSNVWAYDKSANTVSSGIASTVHTFNGTASVFSSVSAGAVLLRLAQTNAVIQLAGSTTLTGGGSVRCYGTDHASSANRVDIFSGSDMGLRVNGNGNVVNVGFNLQVAGHATLDGNITHQGSNIGFFSKTPRGQYAYNASPSLTDIRDILIGFGLMAAS